MNWVLAFVEGGRKNVAMRSKSYTEQFIHAASGTHSKQKNTSAMSSIQPYHRGYRLALHDVRHATMLYIKTIDEPSSSIQAINMAADNLAVELEHLKKNAIVKNVDGSSTTIQSSASVNSPVFSRHPAGSLIAAFQSLLVTAARC